MSTWSTKCSKFCGTGEFVCKLIVSDKRTSLKHELIDKLVILRMNLKFMIYCRGKNGSIGKVNKVQNVIGNDEDIYLNDDE